MVEDKYVRGSGLYGLWTTLYLANVVCMLVDNSDGPVRDFNMATSLMSHIYLGVAAANNIWGSRKPSSMMLVAGPVHQYSFWLFLAYYKLDVFNNYSALGVMNVVHVVVVGMFTIDMIVKSWTATIWPLDYIAYIRPIRPSA